MDNSCLNLFLKPVQNTISSPASVSDNEIHFCFCMITPDAIIRGKVAAILQILYNCNIKVVDFSIKYLSDEDIEEIYKTTYSQKILQKQKTHWWLTKRSYSIAPAIGLIVYMENIPPAEDSIYSYIKRLKGQSIPERNHQNTIRGSLHSCSKTLALFHSSDDYSCACREHKMFFRDGVIDKLLSKDKPYIYDLDYICNSILDDSTTDISAYVAFYRYKVRILLYIDKLIPQNSRWSTIFDVLYRLYIKGIFSVRDVSIVEEKSFYVNLFMRENKIWENHIQGNLIATFRFSIPETADGAYKQLYLIGMMEILYKFSIPHLFPSLNVDEIVTYFSDAHIYLTQWEKLLIENLLFFYDWE